MCICLYHGVVAKYPIHNIGFSKCYSINAESNWHSFPEGSLFAKNHNTAFLCCRVCRILEAAK